VTRREYDVSMVVNGIRITKIIIDPHYEKKHADTVNDEVILELVKNLNGLEIEPAKVGERFSYFEGDRIEYRGKRYKLIWLLEEGHIYIGIVNAYRR
jgi:hypothetical protein